MDQDPYARFVSLGRRISADPPLDLRETSANTEGAAARLREGIVVTTAPLCVKVAGLKFPAKALKLNERLAKGARWKLKHPEEVEVEQTELDLEAGDRVLLLSCDDQMFYVVMKVVDAK